MITAEKITVTVEAIINAPVEKVWKYWTDPIHIIHWNYAPDDWHTSWAENDLRPGGRFISRMEAKDGSQGFDYSGSHVKVEENRIIESTLDDGRKVFLYFDSRGDKTHVRETFETESQNSVELQQQGWQMILNNFKKYVESSQTEPLHFEILINAPVEKVHRIMLGEKSYLEWTKEFNPDSHFKGSWKKGSKVLFIGSDEEGNTGGMVSRIKENIPGKFVSIEHLGILKGDKEIVEGPEVEDWKGALENYTFKAKEGKTHLMVDIDSNEEFKSYLTETWPKALNRLKSICED